MDAAQFVRIDRNASNNETESNTFKNKKGSIYDRADDSDSLQGYNILLAAGTAMGAVYVWSIPAEDIVSGVRSVQVQTRLQ